MILHHSQVPRHQQVFQRGRTYDWLRLCAQTVLIGSLIGTLVCLWLRPDLTTPLVLLAACGGVSLALSNQRYSAWVPAFGSRVHRVEHRLALANWVILAMLFTGLLLNVVPPTPVRALIGAAVAVSLTLQVNLIRSIRSGTVQILQLLLLNFYVRIASAAEYPSIVGIDPWFHSQLTLTIAAEGHVPQVGQYTQYPFAHVAAAATQLLTGLEGKWLLIVSWTGVETLSLIFVYAWVSRLINPQVAFLGVLLGGLYIYPIRWGFWPIPMALAPVALANLLFLEQAGTKGLGLKIVVALTTLAIILLHPLGSIGVALLLGAVHSTNVILRRIIPALRSITTPAPGPIILLLVGTVGYWMYASGTLTIATNIAQNGVVLDRPFAGEVRSNIRDLEVVLMDQAPTWLLLCLPVLGMLWSLRLRKHTLRIFGTAMPALVCILVSLGASITGRNGILPERWLFFASVLAVPALGLALVALARTPRIGRFLQVIVVGAFCLLNIGHYLASLSPGLTPTHQIVPRAAFTQAELDAAATIEALTGAPVVVDQFFARAFAGDTKNASGFLLGQEPLDSYLALRSIVGREPVWFRDDQTGAVGSGIVDQSQLEAMTEDLSVLYDNGAVRLLWPGGK